jgi:hypothetical protein
LALKMRLRLLLLVLVGEEMLSRWQKANYGCCKLLEKPFLCWFPENQILECSNFGFTRKFVNLRRLIIWRASCI